MYSSFSVAAAMCSCVFATLAIAAVGIRFRARIRSEIGLGLDDWLMLVSLAFAFSICCLILYGSFYAGIGQDLSTITQEDYTKLMKHLYFGAIMAYICYGFVKLAVLQFYKRIFAVPNFILSANITVAFVVLFMIAAMVTQIFSAWPISDYWTLGKTYSVNYGALVASFAAIDLGLDIVILCLPIPAILRLQMNRNKKLLLLGMFWMGFFCVVATAVRLYFAYKMSEAGLGRPVSDQEFSYIIVNVVIWVEIEACCSVIAGCLPTYGPLLRSIRFPESLTTTLRSLIDSVKRKTTDRSDHTGQKNSWYPTSEDCRNFVTTAANNKAGGQMEQIEGYSIHGKRGFDTDAHRNFSHV